MFVHFASFRWEAAYFSRQNRFVAVLCPAGLIVARYEFKPLNAERVIRPERFHWGRQTTIVRWLPGFRITDDYVGGGIPLWPFILAAIPVSIAMFYRDRRVPPGRCPKCRYDLTGNISGGCPECGTQISIE